MRRLILRGYWRGEVVAPATLAIWPGRRHAGVAAMLQSVHSEHPCGLRSDCAVLGNAADHLYFRRIQEKADGNDETHRFARQPVRAQSADRSGRQEDRLRTRARER